jgi:hypothetical protein
MREVSMPQFWKRLRHQVKGLEEARARVGGTQRRMCNINLGGAMPARVLETSSGEAMRVS